MTKMRITLDDATELIDQDWFALISQRPIPLRIGHIKLGDARDIGALLNQGGEPTAPEGTAVKTDRGLGELYGIWEDLAIIEEEIVDSKLKFGDRGL